ncbi:hypothetical protein GLOIN_2v1687800 [Rhizophagus irregularis DAOM 181602=DAOM 197198]|nr:hypothetical protein GLOIN_2v1687800 [Rhizophagus irregularis DAOM 181602=DAOM 197198]
MKSKANLKPSRKPSIKSTLIESNYIPIFASWIDKMDSSHYNRKNIPYDFKLLYRSSQDGNDVLSFHKNCDDKGATIWIAKIKNSTQLIGGDISIAKKCYVSKPDRAVYCHNSFGPAMGNLFCENNVWTYRNYDNGNRYPKIGIPANFEVEDYEVFQVIKK